MSKEYNLRKLDNETRLELIAKHKAAGLRRREDERLESADPANKGWPIHLKPYEDEFSDEDYAFLTSRDLELECVLRSHWEAKRKREADEAYVQSPGLDGAAANGPTLGVDGHLAPYPGEMSLLQFRDVMAEVDAQAKREYDASWVDTGSPEPEGGETYTLARDEQGIMTRRPDSVTKRLAELKAKIAATPKHEWVSTNDEIGEEVAA